MENTIDEQAFDQIVRSEYEIASKTRRFLNYVIDVIAIYFLIIVIVIIYVTYNMTNTRMAEYYLNQNNSAGTKLMEYMIGIAVMVIYYTLSEFWFKGKTLGKLLTRTRAVTEDGQRISLKTSLLRSLTRIFPFEAFSFFGEFGWHDSWTNTKVIMDKGWNGK